MRITIDIDETLLAEALCLTGLKTASEVVDLALRTYLHLLKQDKIRRGAISIHRPRSSFD